MESRLEQTSEFPNHLVARPLTNGTTSRWFPCWVFPASEATYILFKAKLSVSRPATCATSEQSHLRTPDWGVRCSHFSNCCFCCSCSFPVFYLKAILIQTSASWGSNQHARDIGRNLRAGKLEDTSGLGVAEILATFWGTIPPKKVTWSPAQQTMS